MDRARVVIADTDNSYIMPLIQKFVEDFFDIIDLEIIDNEEYYESMFVNPQTIDVLIVSDKLYSEKLHLQNIENIFVLSERLSEHKELNNVTFIYKYTSVREIFIVITGKCGHILGVKNEERKKTQIVLVSSGAGGVGKTTVSMGISTCLAQNYKKVLYLNASRLQLYQAMLSNDSPISETDIYVEMLDSHNDIYQKIKHTIRNERFDYIPPFKASLMALGIDYSVFERIALSAQQSQDYDYIIIDADNVFDEYKARLIDIADKVIIVTLQNEAEVYATNVLVKNIGGINKEKYIFLCNDFDTEKRNALMSSERILNFSINEYIEHIEKKGKLTLEELSNKKDIRKTTFLIL